MRNILLTGLPRAGTTLAASLLDAAPDSVCLNEPEWQRPHPSLSAEAFARAVKEDFDDVRKKLLAGIAVPDRRAADGSALTNYYDSGTKNNFVMHDLLRPGLTEDFTLAMKHNGPYLAALPELVALGCFEIRAILRHPLPVLRSWRRLDLPISRGELPNATAYWPEMKALTSAKMELLEKQVRMLELMVARILEHQSQITVVRYEDQVTGDRSQLSEKETAEDKEIMEMLKRYAPRAMRYYEANGSPPSRG
ncbi:MAG: hypothetical protein SFX19_02785 [Alphaproteobacteria bacterium]|nr:hypothetical protein [Alphaproteobacteria bacterium]